LVVGIGIRAARSLTVRVVVAIRILFALGDDGLPVGGEGPLGTGAALREGLELHRFVSAGRQDVAIVVEFGAARCRGWIGRLRDGLPPVIGVRTAGGGPRGVIASGGPRSLHRDPASVSGVCGAGEGFTDPARWKVAWIGL